MTNERKPNILLIELNPRNLELLTEFINRLGYSCVPMSDITEIMKDGLALKDIDLALVDISGYGFEIWEVCEVIRSRNIQLLIVSQKQSNEITNESLRFGATGLLIKPLVMKELASFLKTLLYGK